MKQIPPQQPTFPYYREKIGICRFIKRSSYISYGYGAFLSMAMGRNVEFPNAYRYRSYQCSW